MNDLTGLRTWTTRIVLSVALALGLVGGSSADQPPPPCLGSDCAQPRSGFSCPPGKIWVFLNGQAGCDYCDPASRPADETQTLACGIGHSGSIVQSRSYQCNQGTNSWEPTGWVTTSSSCYQSDCLGVRPADDTRSSSCPAGHSGSIAEARSYSCGGASANWAYLPGEWRETANSCTQSACLGSQPADESAAAECGAGYSGQRFYSRSYFCGGSMAAWQFLAGSWTETGNTCSMNACPGSAPPSDSSVEACPSGYSGSRVMTRSYTCGGAASGWTYVAGGWSEASNTCTQSACGGSAPTPESQTVECPAGYIGQRTLARSYTCAGASSGWSFVAGDWAEVANTCTQSTCTGAAPGDEAQHVACDAGFDGVRTFTRSYSCGGAASGWSFVAGNWTETSNTCAQNTCLGSPPIPETMTTACDPGFSGQRTLSRPFTCGGAATGWSFVAGNWTEVSNTCGCPSGMSLRDGQCVTDVDRCDNINGMQISIPSGYEQALDIWGATTRMCCPIGQVWNNLSNMCEPAPSSDVCPTIPGVQEIDHSGFEIDGARPTKDGWWVGFAASGQICGSLTGYVVPVPDQLPGSLVFALSTWQVLTPYGATVSAVQITGAVSIPVGAGVQSVSWPIRIRFSNGDYRDTEGGAIVDVYTDGGSGGGEAPD